MGRVLRVVALRAGVQAMTPDDVREMLRVEFAKHIDRKGSTGMTAWAADWGVKKSHLSSFMTGKRDTPTSDVLNALGLEWRITRKVIRPPTEEEIDAAMTTAGGWTRATLAGWGVSWPPPKGWRKALIAQGIEARQGGGDQT